MLGPPASLRGGVRPAGGAGDGRKRPAGDRGPSPCDAGTERATGPLPGGEATGGTCLRPEAQRAKKGEAAEPRMRKPYSAGRSVSIGRAVFGGQERDEWASRIWWIGA